MTLVALSFYLPSCVTEIKHVVALVFILGWKKKKEFPWGHWSGHLFPLKISPLFFFQFVECDILL